MRPILRMCISCRKLYDRRGMSRFVKTADGVILDGTGKLDGRGAYLCDSAECLEKLKKKKLLNRAFSCNIDDKIYLQIAEERLDKKQS